jgi:hypothetical protein
MTPISICTKAVLKEGITLFLLVVLKVNRLVKQLPSSMSESALVAIDTYASCFESFTKFSFILRILLPFLFEVHCFQGVLFEFKLFMVCREQGVHEDY